MNKSNLYLYLRGGLGNQMFQYATARALSLSNNATLVIDSRSGFVRDFTYKRSYELDSFCTQSRKILPHEVFPIWLYRWHYRKTNRRPILLKNFWFGSFISEPVSAWIPSFDQIILKDNTWLVGYWQSPHYFSKISSLICQELMPPPCKEFCFNLISNKILNCESVALGIRLYEESKDPLSHSSSRSLKSISEIQLAVDNMLSSRPNSTFFVFCTHRSSLLQQLKLPSDTVFLIGDEGYSNPVATLWLLTLCRHHIITNSSFFWWGAWLSQTHHFDQSIFAANNFINQDSICNHWRTF